MVKTAMGPPLDASWECQTMQHLYIFGKSHAAVKVLTKATKCRQKNSKFLLKMDPFNTNLDLKIV